MYQPKGRQGLNSPRAEQYIIIRNIYLIGPYGEITILQVKRCMFSSFYQGRKHTALQTIDFIIEIHIYIIKNNK